jgi:cytochrome P450
VGGKQVHAILDEQNFTLQILLKHPQLTANAVPIAMQVVNQCLLNPHLLPELRSEITKSQIGPTSFDIARLTNQPKLKSIYLEALRWATASPSPRIVREDCELGGYKLKATSMLIVSSRSLQMDSATWKVPGHPESDPSLFWPERFLDGDKEREEDGVDEIAEAEETYAAEMGSGENGRSKKTHAEPISGPKSKKTQQRMLALRPFGGGTTLCPGRHFATNEILGGLAALMLRLEIEVVEEELKRNGVPQPNLMKQGGLFPDRPLMVRMRRRRS